MTDVFVDLIPLIVAATLAPIFPIIVLLLLQSERGLGKAIAFVIGAVTVRLAQGVIFGLVFRSAVEAESAAGLQLIAPTLLTILGILLLVAGVKKVRKEDDGEDGEPKQDEPLSVFVFPFHQIVLVTIKSAISLKHAFVLGSVMGDRLFLALAI